ncbi:hypothetical protein LINPERPRIM_LOCUS31697 [Linum perenne]
MSAGRAPAISAKARDHELLRRPSDEHARHQTVGEMRGEKMARRRRRWRGSDGDLDSDDYRTNMTAAASRRRGDGATAPAGEEQNGGHPQRRRSLQEC